jgi:hypothetical protein
MYKSVYYSRQKKQVSRHPLKPVNDRLNKHITSYRILGTWKFIQKFFFISADVLSALF